MWADHNMHLDEAEEMIGGAQLDPNNGAYLDSLGWLHYRKGKFEEALNELLRAAQNLTGRSDRLRAHRRHLREIESHSAGARILAKSDRA